MKQHRPQPAALLEAARITRPHVCAPSLCRWPRMQLNFKLSQDLATSLDRSQVRSHFVSRPAATNCCTHAFASEAQA